MPSGSAPSLISPWRKFGAEARQRNSYHEQIRERTPMPSIAAATRSSKLAACALLLALTIALPAQNGRHITTPQEALGFDIGDDYHLANYTQLTAWWQKLAAESDRMKLIEIGKTEEGRPQWMAILTSPENHRNLAR